MPSNQSKTSRRTLIGGLTGVLFATAGCLGSNGDGTADTATASATATTEPASTSQTAQATETAQSDESDSIDPAEEEAGSADFNVTAIHAPKQAQIGVDTPIELEIKNVGGEAGTLTSGISVATGRSAREWTGVDQSIEEDFDAGETKTYSITLTWPFLETVHLRFDELYTTIEIEFVTRVLSRDETYQTPTGIELEVNDVGSQSHFVYTDPDGEEIKRFPDADGTKYIYVEITATNVAEELVETPGTRRFSVTADIDDRNSAMAQRIYRDNGVDWKFPSEKRLNAGESVSGKLLFVATQETDPENIAFGIEDRVDRKTYKAYWTS